MIEPRRRMRVDPQFVFGLSLIVSLLISWRGFSGAMHGSSDIMTVGVRFLIAVAVVWTGLYLVASLIAGYAATPQVRVGVPGARAVAPSSGARELEADNVAAVAAETETAAG